jgi:hypothetical protein
MLHADWQFLLLQARHATVCNNGSAPLNIIAISSHSST